MEKLQELLVILSQRAFGQRQGFRITSFGVLEVVYAPIARRNEMECCGDDDVFPVQRGAAPWDVHCLV
jgi:hypothetical protein